MALVTWAFVVLVLVIVLVLTVLKFTQGSTTVQAPPVTPASPSVVAAATSVPSSAFDEVAAPQGDGPAPTLLEGQPPLDSSGKPEVVFVGGEFCPYCAAERWALVVALGRFGTFSHLGSTSSSQLEAFGGTPTFSFDGSSYRSRYVAFTASEEYGQAPSATAPAGYSRLEKPSASEQTLLKRYDEPQYSGEPGLLPFVDIGNRLLVTGAGIGFSPGLLQGSMNQIADELSDPRNTVSRAVLGAANELTAAMCSQTGQRPGSLCDTSGVRAAAQRLGIG